LEREESLSPYATRTIHSAGRELPETPSPIRTDFQRDRDRILHTKAFRRLKHKTQVFIAPLGDHFATRLTHTLEVSQIARTIARALNLNEDLTEAIALGHDLGHTPFGHIGEEELAALHPGGFRHNHQGVRIVEQVEKDGRGLNLTWEVRQGILHHSKPRGDFLADGMVDGLSLEGQVCRISDAVAYLNHDLQDAFRANALRAEHLPDEVSEVLGARHAQRVDTMVTDIIETSWAATGLPGARPATNPVIAMSDETRHALNTLREFMFEQVYVPEAQGQKGRAAREIVRLLYKYFDSHRSEIPPEFRARSRSEDSVVADFISGMTDHYALRSAERIEPGISAPFGVAGSDV
jgi:dGTPase